MKTIFSFLLCRLSSIPGAIFYEFLSLVSFFFGLFVCLFSRAYLPLSKAESKTEKKTCKRQVNQAK